MGASGKATHIMQAQTSIQENSNQAGKCQRSSVCGHNPLALTARNTPTLKVVDFLVRKNPAHFHVRKC